MSKFLVVGNWKMNGSLESNKALLQQLCSAEVPSHVEVGICAPYVYLAQLQQLLRDSDIRIGAQNISIHNQGAYTGEISGSMLQDFACDYVIVGHSERRQYHSETNASVGQKAKAALQHGLTPIICVGETLEHREAASTLKVVEEQLVAIKKVLSEPELAKTVIAYEPVWAIGTGLTATPEQAQEVHAFIRQQLGQYRDNIKILYGGSVNSQNAQALFAQTDIDGGLVGGASLKFSEFSAIIGV